jgi:hypothetical protein
VEGLIDSLKKSFNAYSKRPFLFVWGALLYILMLITFILAALGVFLGYFLFLSVFGQELSFEALSTLAVIGVIVLLFLFFLNGINASIAKAFRQGMTKKKMSLAQFYSYAVDQAPSMFIIMLVRDFIWLLLVGPALFLYVEFLEGYEYMDMLIGTYGFFMTFAIHMVFTPSFVITGAFGGDVFNSLKYGIQLWREKHIFFIGLYIVFAFAWILNFVPFLQIASLFFLYPVVYAAMAVMIDTTIKMEGD